jgi:hypothetical protein
MTVLFQTPLLRKIAVAIAFFRKHICVFLILGGQRVTSTNKFSILNENLVL